MFLWLICIFWILAQLHAPFWVVFFTILGYIWYLLIVRRN